MDPKDLLDALQWPAMAVTVTASWLVASTGKRLRQWGFWVFLASNLLWTVWGWHTHAYGLIALQFCLAGLNMRGAKKNDADAPADAAQDAGPKLATQPGR